ncbi:MAG TPA: aspartyl/asparaginyl beta-hydroxylase domain-containing protein [Gammaproteobacteria bacterium]
MIAATAILILLASFFIASITYVYAFRGNYRSVSLREYMRKCWPMFAPFNCLLYMATERRARRPIMDLADFAELEEIRKNWKTIRDEALALQRGKAFEHTTRRDSQAYYDVGFHTFFKYGWSKYYLKWYGYTHESGKRSCPETVRILESVPGVKGALFTLLPPGSKLTPHSDPFACSLRYHLGLATPNSDACWINIDGTTYSWRDGDALLFDETYIHHAANDTGEHRLILMCDIARPMNGFGRIVNFFYSRIMRLMVVPNDASDRRGGFNALFSTLGPMLEKGKQLKQTRRGLYKFLKHTINGVLALILLSLLTVVLYTPYKILTSL